MAWTQRFVALFVVAATCYAAADFDGPAPVAWRWAQSTSVSPSGSPQISGENVVVASGGRIYCLDRKTGNEKWRWPVGEPLPASFRSGSMVSGNTVVAAADNKTVYAIDATSGQLKWQYLANGNIVGCPMVASDHVVVGISPSSVMSVKLENGAAEWDKPLEVKGSLYPNMSVFQDSVIALTNTPSIVSIGAGTKKINWEIPAGQISGNSGTAVYGDTIYVNSGYYLTAIRAVSGGKKWDKRVDQLLTFAPAVSAKGVAIVTIDGIVYTFDTMGNFMYRKGIDLDSSPVAPPSFVGSMVAVGTENGVMNVLDPRSGDISFNYVIPPLFKGMKVAASGSGKGGNSGKGGSGGGSGDLGGAPAASTDDEIRFVPAAGPAVGAGDSMFVLVKDGSLLAFDKKLGVDLTAPNVKLAWPNAGEQISGQPPLEFLFLVEDAASGVNPASVKVTINGEAYTSKYTRDGHLVVKISASGANRPISDGRAMVVVTATDWMGNTANESFNLSIDNTLPASGAQPVKEGAGKGGGKKGGLGGG